MIRVRGTREDGTPMILIVLAPSNIRRLQDDKPIILDLQHLAPGILTGPLQLTIAAAKDEADFARFGKLLTEATSADGGTIHVIPKGPTGEQ